MAVTKLDITLAARSAAHLYLLTDLMILTFLGMFIRPFLAGIVALMSPDSSQMSVIPSIGFIAIPIVLLTAIFYTRQKLNLWSYIICAISLGVIVLTLSMIPPSEGLDNGDFFLLSLYAIYFIRVLIDFVRLPLSKHKALSMSQMRLANQVSRLARDHRSSVPWLHRPTNPVPAYTFAFLLGLSVLVTILITFVTLVTGFVDGRSPFTSIFPLVGYGSFFIFFISMFALLRRHYVLRADRVLELDSRRPILFLRSFGDDEVRLWGKGLHGKFRRITIDEAIKRLAERLGPFIAIANPNTKLPRLGAAQTFFPNDTWQNAIVRWVEMAQLIVMVAGRTEGVRWELDHIFSNEEHAKLVIFLPPSFRKNHTAAALWFEDHFSQTRYWHDLSSIDPKRVIGIAFRKDGLFVVETHRIRKRELDYLVAFQAIVFGTIALSDVN